MGARDGKRHHGATVLHRCSHFRIVERSIGLHEELIEVGLEGQVGHEVDRIDAARSRQAGKRWVRRGARNVLSPLEVSHHRVKPQ